MMQEKRNEKDAARTPNGMYAGEALQHNTKKPAYDWSKEAPQDVVPQSGFVFSAENEPVKPAGPAPVRPARPAAAPRTPDLQDYLQDLGQQSVSVDELLGFIHTLETEMPDAAPFGTLSSSKEKELPQLRRLRDQAAIAAAAKKRLDARLAVPQTQAETKPAPVPDPAKPDAVPRPAPVKPEPVPPEETPAEKAPVPAPAAQAEATAEVPAEAAAEIEAAAAEEMPDDEAFAPAQGGQWKENFLTKLQQWFHEHSVQDADELDADEKEAEEPDAQTGEEAGGEGEEKVADASFRAWLMQMRDRFTQLSEEIDEKLEDAPQSEDEQAKAGSDAEEPDAEADEDADEEEAQPQENAFAAGMRQLRDKFRQMAAAIEEKLSADKAAPAQEPEEAGEEAEETAAEEDEEALPPENRFAAGLREFWSKYITLEAADEELTEEQAGDDTWQQIPETELDDADADSEEDEIELGRFGGWLGGLLDKLRRRAPEEQPAETAETEQAEQAGEEEKQPAAAEAAEAPAQPEAAAEDAPAEDADLEQSEQPEQAAAAETQQPEKKLVTWLHLVNDWFDEPVPEQPEQDNLPMEEYLNPEDAPRVQQELEKKCTALTLRTVLAGVLTAALLMLDLAGQQGSSLLTGVDPVAAPATWVCVNLLLLAICAALDLRGLVQGLRSLLPGRAATADGLTALAVAGAGLQLLTALLFQSSFDPMSHAVFAGVAAAMVFAGLLGKRMAAAADRDGFDTMTDGVEHATAYCLEEQELSETLCKGMGETQPNVLLSRPDALMRGFVAQSNAPHYCDRRATQLTRLLCVAALLAGVLALVRSGNAVTALTSLAGVLCMGVPAGMLLMRGVTTMRMQRAASRLGAVVPGWPAIEKLGKVNVVQVDASDLFPPACAYLVGIKTLRKERIDTAILYATSILVAGCNTLAGLFCEMIENHTDMLYPMNELETYPGLGYGAFCDDCRVLLGTRRMMEQEQIKLPPLEYEQKYSNNGSNHVLYLAVSGRLSAMFVFGYKGTKKVAQTLRVLRRANIRLMVTAQDPTLTAARIEKIYRMQSGFIKVLNGEESRQLKPAVGHRASQEGCMAHLGSFASLVGGLQAASGAEHAQHSAGMVQVVSAIVSAVLGLLLSLTGGMASIALTTVLLYQLAWLGLSLLVAASKKY